MRVAVVSLAVLAMLMHAAPAAAATRYDPRLRFATIRTEHFDIHFHRGEERLAQRLAGIAESVRERLRADLGVPRARVEVILVNQDDIANGWATPFPYDAIQIAALPPVPQSLIGNTIDWLELVFTHEYTHVAHLDRTRGVMRIVRGVFGRVPIAFPNAFLPTWQVEGLATYEESRQTGGGRVPAADFRALVNVAAWQRRFLPRDRATGGLVDWPSGHAPYAYGAYFHEFLSNRYGAGQIARLADATSGRVPYFGSGAFRNVFGASVGSLWNQFRESREALRPPDSPTDASAVRLTHQGFQVAGLRLAGDGSIYYGVTDARRFPALMVLRAGGTPRRLAWRYLGNGTATSRDWIVFDQLRTIRSVALHSDLYAVARSGGRVRRLTSDARAGDPDLSPDERAIACTVERDGRHAIAVMDFAPSGPPRELRVLAGDDASDYSWPRWSPDGSAIAAARRHGGRFEIVLIDAATGAMRTLLSRPDRRVMTPSWTPDGRAVLFTMDEADRALNVFAVTPADGTIRRVTDSVTGAREPQLSGDGRTLVYVGYSVDGNDVFSLSTDPASWPVVDLPAAQGFSPAVVAQRLSPAIAGAAGSDPALRAAPYNPWRTLRPTYWTPIVATDAGEALAGAGTAMSDALGRHVYAVDAAWSAHRARPDWHASYAYDRWRPTLFAAYSDDTDPVRGGDVRSREVETGAVLTLQHVRHADSFFGAFDAERDELSCPGGCAARVTAIDRRSARAGWFHDSRRAFGYSISTEEGFAVETSVEAGRVSPAAGAGAGVLDARGYRRLTGHAVVAVRAAAALGWGDVTARRVFSASGPGPSAGAFDFGRDTVGLLRGFDPEDVVGTRVAVLNADVRFPIARPQRGAGSWPVFVRALHGAAFVDAGQAWDAAARLGDARISAGGECSLDTVLGFSLPVTFTAGAAWTRDPASPARRHGAIFARIGRAF